MSYGRFAFSDSHNGGILWLAGGTGSYRFYVGPDGVDRDGGVCALFREGHLMTKQFTTSDQCGRFAVYGALRRGDDRVWLVQGGAVRGEGPIRSGFLNLRGKSENSEVQHIVRIGSSGWGHPQVAQLGDVQVLDAALAKARIWITGEHEGRLNLYGRDSTLVRIGGRDAGGSLRLYATILVKTGAMTEELMGRFVALLEGTPVAVSGGKRGHLVLYDTHPDDHTLFPQAPGIELAVGGEGGRLHLRGANRNVALDEQGLRIERRASDATSSASQLFAGIDDGAGTGFVELRRADPLAVEKTMVIDVEGLHTTGVKNFFMDHPEDAGAAIYYSALEGPEAGVYVRGTTPLASGRASVQLPEHFTHVCSEVGLTAHVTPRSSASRGLAATLVTTSELVIEELSGGVGDYDVDFMVRGVRRGQDPFQVVRPQRVGRGRRKRSATGG